MFVKGHVSWPTEAEVEEFGAAVGSGGAKFCPPPPAWRAGMLPAKQAMPAGLAAPGPPAPAPLIAATLEALAHVPVGRTWLRRGARVCDCGTTVPMAEVPVGGGGEAGRLHPRLHPQRRLRQEIPCSPFTTAPFTRCTPF